MRIRIFFPTVLGAISLLALTSSKSSAQSMNDSISEHFGIIDQAVASSFRPESVFLLVAGAGVKEFPAVFLTRGGSGLDQGGEILAASLLPQAESLSFSFFLKGHDLSFAATPVRTWSRESIRKNTVSYSELTAEVSTLSRQLKDKQTLVAKVEQELDSLRSKASAVAGVDEIIDLKIELARLRGFGDQKAAERERLRDLVSIGRKRTDPEGVDALRQELSLHLADTARATAMADRLRVRRKEAARATLDKKLAFVKEMSRYNPEELAAEVIRLRNRRRELEARLNLRPAPAEQNDF